MPFLLNLIKNPAVIKWGIIIAAFVALFSYGKIQYVRLELAKADLVTAEYNITTLETSLTAERSKSAQRLIDATAKQKTIDELTTQREVLDARFIETQSELNDLLTNVIPNIKTPADVVEAKRVIQYTLTNSYNCITNATGSAIKCDQ